MTSAGGTRARTIPRPPTTSPGCTMRPARGGGGERRHRNRRGPGNPTVAKEASKALSTHRPGATSVRKVRSGGWTLYWAASRYRLRRGSNPDHSFDKRFSMTTGPQLSYYYPSMIDTLITNGQVIDGSDSPRFFAAVAVSGDTVTIHRGGEVPYRLIAQTMSPSGRECYPLTRSEHLDVLAFRPYTLQPNNRQRKLAS